MASKKLKLGDIVFCERRSGLLGRNELLKLALKNFVMVIPYIWPNTIHYYLFSKMQM